MKHSIILYALFFCVGIFAQNSNSEKIESIYHTQDTNVYEEIVITGQINPQTVKKSVFEVNVITQKEIQLQAGNTLADVLNNTLNLSVIPNSSTGKSEVQMFGMDGQYLKILVDNVPLMNEEGMGNNTDLTQINIDDIQRIEIVEGAMGVQYGANAVSGIINIITKKGNKKKWNIGAFVQEETIGNEYNFSNQGRHIQNVSLGHRFNNKWYANVSFNRNQFNGYYGNKKGGYYDQNDKLRGYEWLPKTSLNTKALVDYSGNNFNLTYKFEFFDEGLHQYNSSVHENYNAATLTRNPTSNDKFFKTQRIYNSLHLLGSIDNKINYNITASYQKQSRDVTSYTYYIHEDRKENITNTPFESRHGIFSRGTFSNFIKTPQLNLQLGYALNIMNGYSSTLAGDYEGSAISRTLQSYDVFIAGDYDPIHRLSFQPGARLMYNPMFGFSPVFSLSSKYVFSNRMILRLILGNSQRTPSYDELYTYFVDVNHNVQGNDNLNPERGYSAFLHLKKRYYLNSDRTISWMPKMSMWYLNIQDKIDLIFASLTPLKYKFENINAFQSTGVSFTNAFRFQNWQINLGASYNGVSKVMGDRNSLSTAPPDDFLFTLQANGNISYNIPKWGTTFSLFYKYTGATRNFLQQQDQDGETQYVIATQEDYQWVNLSAQKKLGKYFELTVGVRNLFDVTSIATTTPSGSQEVSSGVGHSQSIQNVMLGYGRSYFIKLNYNLNF